MSTCVAENTHCAECGKLTERPGGLAEYHPYQFCRIYKLGGDPWRGMARVNLNQVTPEIKAVLEENCRKFWRAYHMTEVTLP